VPTDDHSDCQARGETMSGIVQIDSHLLARLTTRERQIISLVAQGLMNKEISRHLNIEVSTIKMHLHNIYAKLRVGGRIRLAAAVSRIDDRFWA
jgi:DNA-binding NarL/FixJ family response regulator